MHTLSRLPALTLALAAALALPAWASGGEQRGGRGLPADMPKAYTAECAGCHVAYPPGMLPAASWQRIMAGLDKHYGSDASLDAATVQQLSQWLGANAGTWRKGSTEVPPQDRISRSAWFERKHRKIDAAVWKLPSVKSAAQCAACHGGAEQGRYDEHDLKVPAGVSLWQRRAWWD